MDSVILIPAFVAIFGWIVSHQFAAWRDRQNKRREQRVNYLISTFRSLSKANHHPRLYEIADEIEGAVSDIQFLGNEEQIKAAQEFAHDLGTTETADLDPLLFSLRRELRRELGRNEYSGKLIWLRIGRRE